MTQAEQRITFGLDDFSDSGMTPPGRYYTQAVWFVDDFNYGGQQDYQTALRIKLVTDQGAEYEVTWTVGPKTKLWPTKDGTGLVGGQPGKASNFYHGLDQMVKSGGLPASKLAGQTNIAEAMVGWWADWDTFSPPGRTVNARGNMPTILVPMRIFLDGPQPAQPQQVQQAAAPDTSQAPPSTSNFQAGPPPAAFQAGPPPSSEATPQPPPPVAVVETPSVAGSESTNESATESFSDMIRITKELLAQKSPITRQELYKELFQGLTNGHGEPASLDQKGSAISALYTPDESGFGAAMTEAGLTLTGEAIS